MGNTPCMVCWPTKLRIARILSPSRDRLSRSFSILRSFSIPSITASWVLERQLNCSNLKKKGKLEQLKWTVLSYVLNSSSVRNSFWFFAVSFGHWWIVELNVRYRNTFLACNCNPKQLQSEHMTIKVPKITSYTYNHRHIIHLIA